MRTCMFSDSFRNIVQEKAPFPYAPAEIHVFEPEWKKALVESTHFLPHGAANHEERTRRLLYSQIPGVVQPQTTVSPVDRISRPQAIKQEGFQNQSGWRGQAPRHETNLRTPFGIQKPAACASRSRQGAGFPPRLNPPLQ